MTWAEDAGGAPPLIDLGTTITANRFVKFSGVPPVVGLCGTADDADAISLSGIAEGYLAVAGLPVQVEAGAAFSSGATLQSDASGRAITRTTGVAIARALQAASAAGNLAWVVFLSGR
jgi:hypothetical protein